ncbi:MAG TPA: hypothetical protein VHB46_08105 [Burkholderiales bacterium]|nr:hypothetical protein [Burkholderiales bacterium]
MQDRIAAILGFSLVVAGLPALALALDWLAVPPEILPAPLWAMGCGGAALVFAGSSLLLPASMRRPRGLLVALSITALATIFDWIAFAQVPGDWHLLLETLLDTLALKQNAVHNVVVLFAVLLTLLASYSWTRWLGDLVEFRGTPPKVPGRRSKVHESAP